MLRVLMTVLLLVSLAAGLDAAKRKKKAARATKPPAGKTTKKDEVKDNGEAAEREQPVSAEAVKKEESSPVAGGDEMAAYRAIQNRPQSTVQDLADLALMYRGEYAKIPTPEKRLARARELKLIKAKSGNDLLERGTLAYAIMKIYEPEQGALFWLTGWERYAMRDVQEAGIMPTKAAVGQHMSGEQLLGTITAAEEYREGRKKWGELK